MKRLNAALLGIIAALAFAAPASAQTYPSKPIRIVVPTPPAGGTDILARLLAQKLTESLGQPVLVENRPGGAQMIGADLVAKAEPDGHTLLLVNDGAIAINPSLYDKMPYDPQKDLAPVSLVVSAPLVLVVHTAVPAKSVKELVEYAKAKPGQLNFASGGSTSQFAGELFKLAAGVSMAHIGYKGSGQAMIALVAGETQLMFDGIASSLPHITSGKLRALAVTSPKRLAEMPEVPAVSETMPGFEAGTWLGLFATGGTPKPIISKLQAEIARIVAIPELRERLIKLGLFPVAGQPEEFAAVIRSDTEKWARVIRAAKIPKANQ